MVGLLISLSVLGVALAAWRAWQAMRASVDAQMYTAVTVRCLDTGGYDRALKLARAAEPMVYPAAIGAALQVARDAEQDEPAAELLAKMEGAFGKCWEAGRQHLSFGTVDKLQLLASVGPLVWALAESVEVPSAVPVLSGLGLLIPLFRFAKAQRLERDDFARAAPVWEVVAKLRAAPAAIESLSSVLAPLAAPSTDDAFELLLPVSGVIGSLPRPGGGTRSTCVFCGADELGGLEPIGGDGLRGRVCGACGYIHWFRDTNGDEGAAIVGGGPSR